MLKSSHQTNQLNFSKRMPPRRKKNEEERKKQKRDAERKRRQRIKDNPKLQEKESQKEHERYLIRKEKVQIKLIKNLTKREQRAQRKKWKENTQNKRKREKILKEINDIENSTHPSSPISTLSASMQPAENPENHISVSGSSRRLAGRKRIRRDRSKAVRKLKKLELELQSERRKSNRFKKRYSCLVETLRQATKGTPSPKSKVEKFLKGKPTYLEIRKRLVFGETLENEIHTGYKTAKSYTDKNFFYEIQNA